ncbi:MULTISPECIES: DUF1329 domain-containing protein [Pseudomonas]|jgi:hypothetical protein|uniref:DUF1329 domain-containing protein n=1 Tax=Pseudomonas umsongensis TaxID=198618 RepID=A0AAE6ZW26_9PSED|nr:MULTISPECIES: DUF1329 domain-containing protein [Pseudomonas]KEX91108.1 hypothetical protein HA62_26350 [Pseudomonas putida]MDP9686814.1 hypothetical protein [Pseudomonas mohnii]EPA94183.1 hypothetical protein PG5_53360 [Pseudomonas sp. G5(2012)]MBD0678904.1 DUF1329 domain-containing protein [Pseudomonas sp. PSB11]MBT9571193.1 DUF1329 domain-containing protein [Pseudomonas umsongensis]|eukprot:gene5181-5066_t
MKFVKTVLAASLAMVLAAQVQAAVSTQDAAKLGTSLTLVGAEKAGNADGSIPAYNGGLTTPPASFKAGDSMRPDPFASEKPLLVIDGKNVDQYKGMLTATTVELAKRFPTFRVDVFPTHRTVSLPKAILDNGVKNASGAKSLEGGLAIDNVLPGVPFPIPQSGNEAMWNFLLRYQGVSINSKYDSWNVDSAGVPSLATTGQAFISYPIYENLTQPISSADVYYQMKLSYTGPARRAGEAVMLKDAANPLQQPRRAWQYLPGQRRVKLAPNLAYDTPNPGTAGAGTYDDVFVFNGALDRYDWKLVGKQEMIVPYNTYKLTYAQDPKSLTTANHLAPDFVRWEKHRVWVVEGNLKAGARHIYAKRRFYLDEDSWSALASDQYDARGQLYRGSFAFLSQSYDKQVPDSTPFMIYDLVGGSYNINGVVGPYGGIKYIDPLSKAQWSSESLAGSGIR